MASLNNQFYADPVGFAVHHSLAPKDNVTGYTGQGWESTKLTGDFTNWKHVRIVGNGRRALVTLDHSNARGENTVEVSAKVYPEHGRGSGLPTWFLPWDGSGACVELTIPPYDGTLSEYDSPKIFFTAALSGCSVYMKGNPDNPTIYHCGISGTAPNNSPAFYKRLVMTCKHLGIGTSPQGRIQGIGKNAYMDRFTGGAIGSEDRTLVTSQLENQVGGLVIATGYRRWGAIFGIRTGQNWEFYLQRNVMVDYETYDQIVEKSKGLFGTGLFSKTRTREVITKELMKTYPSSLEKIFPGTGQVEMMMDNVIVKV
ncbi:MAG: hypothetical protein QNL62_19855 [Gammaproteobacteria bacterium]|nr:hypothetical protein [Gammaproteobacteria bacterium]